MLAQGAYFRDIRVAVGFGAGAHAVQLLSGSGEGDVEYTELLLVHFFVGIVVDEVADRVVHRRQPRRGAQAVGYAEAARIYQARGGVHIPYRSSRICEKYYWVFQTLRAVAGDYPYRVGIIRGARLVEGGLFVYEVVDIADKAVKPLECACLVATGVVVEHHQIFSAVACRRESEQTRFVIQLI